MTETPRVPEAPASDVPPLLAEPPWTRPRAPRPAEPVVVTGLKRPKAPAVESWPPGLREEFADVSDTWRRNETPTPDDPDWAALAEYFRGGAALQDPRGGDRGARYRWLVLDGPDDLARELLADERYFDDWSGWVYVTPLKRFAARHGLAAHRLLLHAAKEHLACAQALVPFLDDATAQFMIKCFGKNREDDAARAWAAWHGPAAAPFVVPEALRKPGPKRAQAEQAIAVIAREHGGACVLEAARRYGERAVAGMEALGLDPLDRFPDPLPEPDEAFVRDELPRVLLRGGKAALPVPATRNLVTMLRISSVKDPYAGCEQVFPHLDPASLAELAWAMYRTEYVPDAWASPGAEYAVQRLGDATTAARLATAMGRWSKNRVWSGGLRALDVLIAMDTPDTLLHLDRLARKAADAKRMRAHAQARLDRVARERGITGEQLADRLVPDFGLDADGTMTLDYGPRRFTVGFDERLAPYALDGTGKRRTTLPKPGVKDDPALAPDAHRRFGDLKKEARTVAADQIKRLERAMVAGRSWTPVEFREVLAGHPLLRHIVRRLVWSAGPDAFRVTEDGTYADATDDAFVPSPDAAITLPHPLLLKDRDAWTEVFADYEILQPFPQLGRTVHEPAPGERTASRLPRFEGATVPNGPIYGLVRAGWRFGERETGGYQRHVSLELGAKRYLVIDLDPGVRVIAPDDDPVQEIRAVRLGTTGYGGGKLTFDELGPVQTSEVLATLTRLTGAPEQAT
ncbi:DUF4132 domain-containing protein [Actinomadura sp. WMMB 499]|uniref:DUF4132 domain-containing protein n=1 Tax=Actinomadura sp. WMMB 499 TaxID=1219491 RepID=UPI001245F568|nr:DUF4132 domain-containing protein [Actinomadura sp. WMMB 499]QFG23949.1 DUF4132 domain-containing protein [Actinomadura sp. WMMB 499]